MGPAARLGVLEFGFCPVQFAIALSTGLQEPRGMFFFLTFVYIFIAPWELLWQIVGFFGFETLWIYKEVSLQLGWGCSTRIRADP